MKPILTELRLEHLLSIDLQDSQRDKFATGEKYFKEVTAAGPAYALLAADGKVLFCGGCARVWNGRHVLWSMLARDCGPHMNRFIKVARRVIATVEGRVEMWVDSSFPQAHRMAKLLGFEQEGPVMRKFLPDGRDATMYVRFM